MIRTQRVNWTPVAEPTTTATRNKHMAKPSDIRRVVVEQFKVSNKIVPFFMGPPGASKSALARLIAQDLDLPFFQFFASLRQETDLLGVPSTATGQTVWCPPSEIVQWGKAPCLVALEEVPDSAAPMQNALCGMVYDRKVGDVDLSHVYFILTGNRSADKSGANRVTTKLANRTQILKVDPQIDDWVEWATGARLDPMLVQFLRFCPSALNDFRPDQLENATSRSWEAVNSVPTTLPPELYLLAVAGLVGEGRAAEYCSFRRLYGQLPDPAMLVKHPKTAPVPDKLDLLYATVGMAAQYVTVENFDQLYRYAKRLPKEFTVMFVTDALGRNLDLMSTRAFKRYARDFSDLLLSWD